MAEIRTELRTGNLDGGMVPDENGIERSLIERTAGAPKTQKEAANKEWLIKAETETRAVHLARAAAGRADAIKSPYDVTEAEIEHAADKALAEKAVADKGISLETPVAETPEDEKTPADKLAAQQLEEAEKLRAEAAANP